MKVCQFAAVGVVPVAVRILPFEMLTLIPESAVALRVSPDCGLVIETRMPLMFPPLASSVKFGASAVSWLEIVARVPVVKVGKNQRSAVEAV